MDPPAVHDDLAADFVAKARGLGKGTLPLMQCRPVAHTASLALIRTSSPWHWRLERWPSCLIEPRTHRRASSPVFGSAWATSLATSPARSARTVAAPRCFFECLLFRNPVTKPWVSPSLDSHVHRCPSRLQTPYACVNSLVWKPPKRVSMAGASLRRGTAVLMSDNRPTVPDRLDAASLTYPALAFALNALYACEHGYDLLFYQMVAPTCRHVTDGPRHASYCKLPAIADALRRGYSTVIFIDSDSYFLQRNISFQNLIEQYRPHTNAGSDAPRAAWFANDLPQLGDRPNGGLHVWTGGSSALRLLRTWWHLPAAQYGVEHDYEQHTLQWSLSQLHGAVPHIGTLQLRAMADATLTFRHAVAHIDHTKADWRLWTMACALLSAADRLESRGVENKMHLRALLRQAREVGIPDKPPRALEKQLLRATADLMRSGFGSPPAGQVSRPNGARCARGSKTSMLLSLPYNATKISQEVLPPTDLLPALGLPLTAMACRATVSGVLQRWREVPDGTLQLVDQPSFCLGIDLARHQGAVPDPCAAA